MIFVGFSVCNDPGARCYRAPYEAGHDAFLDSHLAATAEFSLKLCMRRSV